MTREALADLKRMLIRDLEAGQEKAIFEIAMVLELVNAACEGHEQGGSV